MRRRLSAPGARPWYIGAGIALLWQISLVVAVVAAPLPLVNTVLALVLLAVFYVVFFFLGPLVFPESKRVTLAAVFGYWFATYALFPLIGVQTIWVWILVIVLATYTGLRLRATLMISTAVVLGQVTITAGSGWSIDIVFAPIVTAFVAVSMIAALLLGRSTRSLRVANDEIARLAVVEERARFGRDLHDVLGHSLTVVTVKSELARRLVKLDPDKAEAEIADIERLAREALADLRLAVTNYREIALDSELIAADTALSAAGITAHLPVLVNPVDPALQGTFAWVLREGVTNVIRHSGARECWVTVEVDSVTIADDGRGCGDSPAGNGLRGLRERAAEAGAEVLVDRSAHGGFELTARRAT